nr:hypothetical protein [Acidobacteriota bacterium]
MNAAGHAVPPRRGALRLLPRGIRLLLLVLILVVLLPLVGLQAFNAYRAYRMRLGAQNTANLEMARAVASAFEHYVESVVNQELGLIVALPRLDQPGPAREVLQEVATLYGSAAAFSWLDADGNVIASSLPNAHGPLRGTEFFQSLRAGRDWAISDL